MCGGGGFIPGDGLCAVIVGTAPRAQRRATRNCFTLGLTWVGAVLFGKSDLGQAKQSEKKVLPDLA